MTQPVPDQDARRDHARGAHQRGRLDLASRYVRDVSSLLAERDDLRGVHAFADVVEESVRWSA